MAEIWIWNSMAVRKRSPSDGFLENGLAVLKSYLEQHNHKLKIIDWQKSYFYDALCFKWLLVLNHISTKIIFRLSRWRFLAVLFYPIFNILQELVTFVRRFRMKRYLIRLADGVINSRIKIFGIKVWYGEAFQWSDWLAKVIRQRDPSILLVAGGFHVTLYEEDFLKNSSFDIGVISEGERVLHKLLDLVDEHIENWDRSYILEKIAQLANEGRLMNLVYRDGAYIKITDRYTPDMKKKPLPLYEPGDIEGKMKVHILLDSLGCPWGKCNFCVHPHFYPGFYPRDVKDILDEIEYMVKLGIGLFRFAGSETPPSFGKKIAQGILERDLKIKYTIGCRAIRRISSSDNLYDSIVKDFEVMLYAGLLALFMGGESGTDVINDKVMNKGVSRSDIVLTAKAFRQAQCNIGKKAYLSLALIYPTPIVEGVSLEQIFDDNISLIKELIPDSVIVSPCTPFKNSRWYRQAKQFGFEIPSDFIKKVMSYEYVLYKPLSLWPQIAGIKIAGLDFKKWLSECERMRKAVESIGIPSDITDEYYLMIEGAGYNGKEGLERFKKETILDLVSTNYRNIYRLAEQTNRLSSELSRCCLSAQ